MYKEYEIKNTEGLDNFCLVKEKRLKLFKLCKNVLALIHWSKVVILAEICSEDLVEAYMRKNVELPQFRTWRDFQGFILFSWLSSYAFTGF